MLMLENVVGKGSSVLSHLVEAVVRTHPFWIFEGDFLYGKEVLILSPVLFLAGLLCSAGGIGGGGVYVTLLMVVGRLAPRDAVPLSKAIVFLGSLASLVLNLRKTVSGEAKRSVIDYSICRIVVPASLIGTLIGVLFNRLAADWIIVSALCVILGFMTVMVSRTALRQRAEEEVEYALADAKAGQPSTHLESATKTTDSAHLPLATADATDYGASQGIQIQNNGKTKDSSELSTKDIMLSGVMLFIVIICGVLRMHSSACASEMRGHAHHHHSHEACRHPINALFFRNTLEGWMSRPFVAEAVQNTFLAVPICTCLSVMIYYSRACVAKEGWTWREVAMYEAMGVTTGCLAGLVGVGGGLIFSPFFLVLGVEPNVAVATSSTCVIFTSSSTTLQYLLTDRIITSLAITYGVVNVVASWAGTSFVHFLQDNFHTRKSYITMIVATGVFVSAVLSGVKFLTRETASH